MEEAANNHEESLPKRSRSSEEKEAPRDISSSSDNRQHSPSAKQADNMQNMSACNSNNNDSDGSYNPINYNGDSGGLSFKMEDSPCSDAVAPVNKLVTCDKDNESMKIDYDDQQSLTMDNIPEKEEECDIDKPTTSATALIKRHKSNVTRNYRVAGRSSLSSSDSSIENLDETQPHDLPQGQIESQEAANSSDDPASPDNNNEAEVTLPPSPFFNNILLSNMSDSSSISISSDTSSESIDTLDIEPFLFGDRYLNPEYNSTDSADLNRLKEKDEEVAKVMNKQKPPYTWSGSYELMRREHGLSFDGKSSSRKGSSNGFQNRFYASRHIVERMQISHLLLKHLGCVNCVNFNKAGDMLVSGSDDARLIVWDWAGNKTKHVWKSGHNANIFQSKFLPSSSCIDIISAGRDGKVRRSIVPPSGGKPQVSNLYSHMGPVHKLVISSENPSYIITVGEDGFICSKDLRDYNSKVDHLKVFMVNEKTRRLRMYSISHHPFAPEICVSGSDQYVRVYDKRSMLEPVHIMSPEHILESHSSNVTCCVYNNTGTEILASYSEDNIYLFDNKNYVPGEYLHSYKGHYNQKTIKGVNFFGPNSEYVISGSDCGNIFFWDKNTEAILNYMKGDTSGVVNCLEPHPNMPVMATSGLDHCIKIWTPNAEKYPPDLTNLKYCVKRNIGRTALHRNVEFEDGQLQFFIRQMLCRHRADRRRNRNRNDTGLDIDDVSTDDSSAPPNVFSESDDESDSEANQQSLSCGTQ